MHMAFAEGNQNQTLAALQQGAEQGNARIQVRSATLSNLSG